jgi:hypothetical protein
MLAVHHNCEVLTLDLRRSNTFHVEYMRKYKGRENDGVNRERVIVICVLMSLRSLTFVISSFVRETIQNKTINIKLRERKHKFELEGKYCLTLVSEKT